MATPRIGAGFRYIYYGVVNASGFMIGSVAAGAAAGASAGSPMLRLEGARTLPIGVPEGDTMPVSGDDEPLVNFSWDSETLPNGVLETAVHNSVFDSLVQGTNIESIGDLETSVLVPSGRAPQDMSLLLQRRAKKWASGNRGVKAWEIALVPLCVIEALYSDFEQRTHQPYRYKVTLNKASRKPTGATFTELLNGTDAAAIWLVESDNPVHLHSFLGDNAQDTFNLAFTPKTDAKIHIYLDGVKQTLTTDYTMASNVITFVAAPGTDVVIGVMYEVDEADLS